MAHKRPKWSRTARETSTGSVYTQFSAVDSCCQQPHGVKYLGNLKHPKNIRSDGFTELLSGSTFQIRSIFDTSGNTYELMTQTVEYGLCGFRKTPLRGQSGVIHQGNSRGILSLGERHNLDQVPARIGRVGCLRNAEVAYQMGIKSTGMTLDRR